MKVKNLEMENLFGEINKENVFVGNIMRCTKYDTSNCIVMEDMAGITSFGYVSKAHEPYKENQILIKICDNPEVYVELEKLKSFLTYIDIYSQVDRNGIHLNEKILSTSSSFLGDIYVDFESLKPYYEEKGKVKIKKIKKDVRLNIKDKNA